MNKKERLYRVVAFLKREELDFLDGLTKDIYFAYGIKIPRTKLIAEIVDIFKSRPGENKKELVYKLLHIVLGHVERRRYPRLKKDLLIGLKKLDSLERYRLAHTENISVGGLKIETPFLDQTLSANQMIELSIRDPRQDIEPLKAFARVAWVKEKENRDGLEIGVMFTYIRKEDKAKFTKYLEREQAARSKIK